MTTLNQKKDKNYENSYVIKPWGSEYVIYRDKKKIGITLLKINPKKETSLHCHSEKKTGFIILSSKAKAQIGIYKKNILNYQSISRLVLRPGLFHKLINPSLRQDLYVLEIETPYKKHDVVRFKDKYGRISKPYEGKKFLRKLEKNKLFFKKPKQNSKNTYYFRNLRIDIKYVSKVSEIKTIKKNSTIAILDGSIKNKKNKKVISFGEIIKTKTLKILLSNFKQNKKILIMQVEKKV